MVSEVSCPYCGAEPEADEEVVWHRCVRCGRLMNIAAQRAFARGKAQYEAAQEAGLTPLNPRRPYSLRDSGDADTLQIYQRAYSAFQLAFQSDLPEALRQEGIMLMAEVTQLLAQRDLASPLEASYWTKVLVERNALQEVADLEARLSAGEGSPLRQLHWRLRRTQLHRALASLGRRLADLEQTIAFVEVPHARSVDDGEGGQPG